MSTCAICGTTENIVHSGIDALMLECGDLHENICYDCANARLEQKQ